MSVISFFRIICIGVFYRAISGKERRHMEHPKSNRNITNVEDAATKTAALFFGKELLPYFGIEGEIEYIAPTESIYLELRRYYQDFNYLMKDGSWIHFEFQSTDKGIPDLKRFRAYEATASYQHNVDIKTYVLYSGTIENPVTEFTSGFNTYRVHPIIMKGKRAEEVFESIAYKQTQAIPITMEDLVPLALCPLMSSSLSQKDRILQAFRIVKQTNYAIPDTDKLEALIYAMASKFLNETERNALKEEIKMTELGLLIYNDGKLDAQKENAKNFFINGASFDLVRKSIAEISDETLHEIYNEVMSNTKS